MKTARLSDVCKLVNGGTPKSGVAEYWGGDVAWLTPAEMGKRPTPYLAQTARTISRLGLANCSARLVPVGAVVMSTRAPIGHLVIPESPMAFNQGCRGLIPDETLDTKYLYYFLWFSRDALNELGTGTTFKELSSSALGNFRIPLPPLEEQRRIVVVLDEVFAAIATATANAEKNLANARELFACTVEEVLEGADDCQTATLSAVADESCSLSYGIVQPGDEHARGLPIVRPTDLHHKYVNLGPLKRIDPILASGYQRTKLRGDELLLCVRGTTGTLSVATPELAGGNVTRGIVPIRFNPTALSQKLGYYLLLSASAQRQIKAATYGTALMQINIRDLKQLELRVPPLITQNALADRLEAAEGCAEQLQANYSAKLDALIALKQSLLHRAFTGELASRAAPATNDNWKAPAFTAHVIALAYRRHVSSGTEATFGRVKAQKALHLCESVGGIDLGRVPIKDAAGPNDFQHMLAAEDWAKANQFFEFAPRPSGNGYSFKKLGNFNAMMTDALASTRLVAAALERAIDPIVQMVSQDAEVFATVHAAWNNLLHDGNTASDDAIVKEARDNWHVAKLKIPEAKFRAAIKSIRTKGLVPDGTAKYVGGQSELF